MISILGAGGAIGTELAKELAKRGRPFRLVGRSAAEQSAAEVVRADLTSADDSLRAVAGTDIAVLLAGLKYDLAVWREMWPRIMRNTIEACKRSGTRLVFFDNVYMYGRVNGPMTESTPFHPCSRKGEIRAEIATMLNDEIAAGNLTGMIARAADFYGPKIRTGGPNILVFDKLAKGSTPMLLGSDSKKHSFTYTPDAGRSLVTLIDAPDAWNQTWHVPTAPDPPTGKEFVELAASEYGRPPKYRVLGRASMRIAGWFDSNIREMVEMMYQYEHDYIFDSTKFTRAFGVNATPYADGIRQTAKA
jgi:nucleoside-diphosphate-sugar epimerase